MICIYPPDCTDFSTNGAGTLTPSSCTVTETLNGGYEVTLEHPIDEAGKWTRLSVGCILRVPVPEAMTPYVKLPDQRIKLDKTSRGVWRLTRTAYVRIQAGFNYKIIGTYYSGKRCAVLGSVYVVTITTTATGESYSYSTSTYPSGSPAQGTTRSVSTWYKVTTHDGVTGYIPSNCASCFCNRTAESSPWS